MQHDRWCRYAHINGVKKPRTTRHVLLCTHITHTISQFTRVYNRDYLFTVYGSRAVCTKGS